MRPDEKKFLNSVVRCYKARPDPEAWLAVADLYEEYATPDNDFAELAGVWRWRGLYYAPLREAWASMFTTGIMSRQMNYWGGCKLGDYRVRLKTRKCRSTIDVTVFRNDTGVEVLYGMVLKYSAKNHKYHTEQFLDIIDCLRIDAASRAA